jgi:hypothetical protein
MNLLEGEKMNIVSTCDLYEASYYLINQCTLEGVETLQLGKKPTCKLFFKGENIYELRDIFLSGDSIASLTNFKEAYSKLLQVTYFAKKEHNKKLKEGLL